MKEILDSAVRKKRKVLTNYKEKKKKKIDWVEIPGGGPVTDQLI